VKEEFATPMARRCNPSRGVTIHEPRQQAHYGNALRRPKHKMNKEVDNDDNSTIAAYLRQQRLLASANDPVDMPDQKKGVDGLGDRTTTQHRWEASRT
jgi:hypothetical protein